VGTFSLEHVSVFKPYWIANRTRSLPVDRAFCDHEEKVVDRHLFFYPSTPFVRARFSSSTLWS